jgi:hypothetical protein
VLPTILLYEQLLDLAPAEEVLVPKDRYIDGVALLQIGRKNAKFAADLDTELLICCTISGKFIITMPSMRPR